MSVNLNSPTYTLSATTTSSNITMVPVDTNNTYVEVYNSGLVPVFIVSGTGVAPTAVFPTSATVGLMGAVVAPGRSVVYEKVAIHEFISGITATGTASVYISAIPSS